MRIAIFCLFVVVFLAIMIDNEIKLARLRHKRAARQEAVDHGDL